MFRREAIKLVVGKPMKSANAHKFATRPMSVLWRGIISPEFLGGAAGSGLETLDGLDA